MIDQDNNRRFWRVCNYCPLFHHIPTEPHCTDPQGRVREIEAEKCGD